MAINTAKPEPLLFVGFAQIWFPPWLKSVVFVLGKIPTSGVRVESVARFARGTELSKGGEGIRSHITD